MIYVTPQEILVIHAQIIDETGGAHGVRDVGLLESASHRPKTVFGGKELYQGVFAKAGAYLEAFVRYHAFVDGNKRTGIAVAGRFLYTNRYELAATNVELEKFVLRVAVQRLEVPAIAAWLKQRAKKR